MIGVLEDDDSTGGLVFPAGGKVAHITTHLDNVETALIVPVDGDGFGDQGFGCDQFDPESRRGQQGGLFLCRAQDRSWQDFDAGQNFFRGRSQPETKGRIAADPEKQGADDGIFQNSPQHRCSVFSRS